MLIVVKLEMIKNREVNGGGSEDAENGTKIGTNENRNSNEEYEFGSDGEYVGEYGPGFAK